MRSPIALDREHLLAAFAATVTGEPWARRLSAMREADSSALHVAVMHQPYLDHILVGRKTIESRFSVNRICPFGAVHTADVLAFKAPSGPIVGLATVEHAAFYELDPATWITLRRNFSGPLCADDDEFWSQRAGARYATLWRVCDPIRIASLPVDKSDRRGWVRLPGSDNQQKLAL
jgi:hypothetical protein